jgi:hypothetical protein
MENKDTAYLSNKGGFTIFSYGGYDFRFKTSDRLVKYLKVKNGMLHMDTLLLIVCTKS